MSNPPQPRWGKEWERRGLELHKAVAEQAEEPQGRATRTDVTSGWQPCSLHLLVGLRWYERELFCARYETPSRTIRDICSLLAASDYQLLDRRWQSVSAIPTVRQLVSCFSDRAACLRILVSASLPHPKLPCLAPRLSHLAVITRLIRLNSPTIYSAGLLPNLLRFFQRLPNKNLPTFHAPCRSLVET